MRHIADVMLVTLLAAYFSVAALRAARLLIAYAADTPFAVIRCFADISLTLMSPPLLMLHKMLPLRFFACRRCAQQAEAQV